MQAVRNLVIVKPFPPNEVSAGGIYLPDTARERKSKATIVAVGRGTKARKMELAVGDIVYHVKGCGDEIEENGEKYYVMNDTDCIAKEVQD